MYFNPLLAFICIGSSTLVSAAAISKRAPEPFSDFTRNEFLKPAADANLWGTLYARSLQLPDESLLMTWENYPKEPPLNGWGMRFQTFLYTLPVPFGGYPADTILASGVSTPESLTGGTWIELYASTDNALTWTFVSHIAYGDGPNTITNGNKALWEPFLYIYDGQLVCHYSDQRDPNHGQKLVHTTTTDLRNWSPIVDDVADPNYEGRPGMTVMTHIESTNKWIMTYENCVTDGCKVYYKIADSPLQFENVQGVRLYTPDGIDIVNGPYVIWTPHPTRDDGSGIVIVSGTNREEVFVAEDAVPEGQWKMVNVNHWSAYSRSLRVVTVQGKRKLFFGNGGNFGPKENNGIACAIIEIPY
ncbi:hypothetical protein CAC42_8062 [Sphaceloma murrayae]|uniref:Glycoside hydrolase family 93 protein n=1 Tax=Sphaceloma murrayae TaxID=2082308 RepID=A0A2K1QRC4_9PEZI|nr:hypothetical protein CAC42_8062 [Sphaceloma murrayae]